MTHFEHQVDNYNKAIKEATHTGAHGYYKPDPEKFIGDYLYLSICGYWKSPSKPVDLNKLKEVIQ